MRALPDSLLGKVIRAVRPVRPVRPWLRVTVSPWWARVLLAAGAQPGVEYVLTGLGEEDLPKNLTGARFDLVSKKLIEFFPGDGLMLCMGWNSMNLRNEELRGMDLRGANLRGMDLCKANLSGMNLRN